MRKIEIEVEIEGISGFTADVLWIKVGQTGGGF